MNKQNYLFALLLMLCLTYWGCNLSAPEPPATCSDNIQNQDEEEVDCGGVCTACPSCVDGIQNQGESGIDCGGPCVLTCFTPPPCNPDTNTVEITGMSVQPLPGFSHSLDTGGNHRYRLSGSGSWSVAITLSKDYNFVNSGVFATNAFVGGSLPMHELWIVVTSSSMVYNVYPGDAYVHQHDGYLTITYCGLTTSNQMLSTTSQGTFTFPAIH